MTDEHGGGPGALGFQSLYRRYRPSRFSEVRGQDHVALALRNAVRDGRVAHAYLFSGPRGTGKTSTARILAKALNCTAPVDGEPCGACESCRAIAEGSSFDVHELDAASNNGVEAMRDLVARAALSTPGMWKVYIVDEVHMLSTAASNALLKTLEEPPEHVVFVLATTDPQRVLPTIRSRTQHFEFHLIDEAVLFQLLADVAADAGYELPEGAITVALRRGRGSARDALSVLDQVIAAGVASDETGSLTDILHALGEHDVGAVLSGLDELLRSGRDPEQVAIELVESLRNGFLALIANGPSPARSTPSSPDELGAVAALGLARVVRTMETIGLALVAMRDAPQPRVTFEVALIRCAHPESDTTIEAVLDRLERLERRVAALGEGDTQSERPVVVPPARSAPATPPEPEVPRDRNDKNDKPVGETGRGGAEVTPSEVPEPKSTSERQEPRPSDRANTPKERSPGRDELVAAWGDVVLTSLRPRVRAVYQVGHFVGVEEGEALLAFPNEAHIHYAEPLKPEVADALGAALGVPVRIRLVVETSGRRQVVRDDRAETGPEKAPATSPAATAEVPEEGSSEELDELFAEATGSTAETKESSTSGVDWAKDRLLEAFPGAEEVTE